MSFVFANIMAGLVCVCSSEMQQVQRVSQNTVTNDVSTTIVTFKVSPLLKLAEVLVDRLL